MNDLLPGARATVTVSNREPDLEAAGPTSHEDAADARLPVFMRDVEALQQRLSVLQALQTEVQQLHEEDKRLTKASDVKANRKAMEDKVRQVSALAIQLKRLLEKLEQDTAQAQAAPGSAYERVRITHTAQLKKKLKDVMASFAGLRTQMQEEERELVGRRLRTVTGKDVSDQDVERVMENGEADDIFRTTIQEQGQGRVLNVLAEIQERNKAVKDLEQSLLELHQIFLDMSVLVEAQGETLDNIEKQVEGAAVYVKRGTTALEGAKRLQKQRRKWMCFVLLVLLVIAIVIVLAVVLTQQPWKNR